MPSPRFVTDSSSEEIQPKEIKEEITQSAPEPKAKPNSHKKGQASIASFFSKSVSTSKNHPKKLLTAPSKSSSDHNINHKNIKHENGNSKTIALENKKRRLEHKHVQQSTSDNPIVIDGSELLSLSSSQTNAHQSPKCSLQNQFEKTVETPIQKQSKFAHDSTWMTPLPSIPPQASLQKPTYNPPTNDIPPSSKTKSCQPVKLTDVLSVSSNESINTKKPKLEDDAKTMQPQTQSQSQSPMMSPTQIVSPAPTTLSIKEEESSPVNKLKTNILTQRDNLRKLYESRKEQLISRALQDCIREDFSGLDPISEPCLSESSKIEVDNGTFPNELVGYLAISVQGSQLTLSALAHKIHQNLSNFVPNISIPIISSKIKLLSRRTAYLNPPSSPSSTTSPLVDIYEDTSINSLWFWELTSPQILLPETYFDVVKKARSIRKKLSNHFKAILKLLAAISDPASTNAMITKEEEKVLKFEREEERLRLAIQIKKDKEMMKAKKLKEKLEKDVKKERKLKEKEADKERRTKEKKEKEELKLRKMKEKEEERKLKDDVLRAKEEERKEKEKLEKLKQEQLEKQKAKMMSFFSTKNKKQSTQSKHDGVCSITNDYEKKSLSDVALQSNWKIYNRDFDADLFRSKINSESQQITSWFHSLSSSAKQSRRRKTKKVPISVLTTSHSSTFQQSYSERRTIFIDNKLKFLFFKEDIRPPYRGTWGKKSKIVTGKTPFGKDEYLDYDVDSEAEWEEGAEDGEDVEDDINSDDEEIDEEGNTREYNYHDNWLMEDGEFQGDVDQDEFAKQIRKKQEEEKKKSKAIVNVCFISPGHGGLSPKLDDMEVEGMDIEEAKTIFQDCDTNVLYHESICLDPFLKIDVKNSVLPIAETTGTLGTPTIPDMNNKELKLFCQFVHKCKFNSKDKLIEELRTKHPNITSSRAQATRKLDSIATKRKADTGLGVVWEVKDEILRELGLESEMEKPSEMDNTYMKLLCEYIHGSNLNSKEKLTEEIRLKYPKLVTNRSQAMRTIVSIADKKKLTKGVVWKVQEKILRDLDLSHLIQVEPCESSKDNAVDNQLISKSPISSPMKVQGKDNDDGNLTTKKQTPDASAKLFATFLARPTKAKSSLELSEVTEVSPLKKDPVRENTGQKKTRKSPLNHHKKNLKENEKPPTQSLKKIITTTDEVDRSNQINLQVCPTISPKSKEEINSPIKKRKMERAVKDESVEASAKFFASFLKKRKV